MQSKLLQNDPTRTFAVVFDTGEEVADGLLRFAREHDLSAARLTAIGALQRATLAFFDVDDKDYKEIPIEDQVEVLALVGNIARYEGAPKLHAHVVVGMRDGTTRGGHLLEAYARPTLEVMLTETPGSLQREMDEESGLPLLHL